MALPILQERDSGAVFGSALGGLLGAGIGAGIERFGGARKLTAKDIKAMYPNISNEEAESLAKLAKTNPTAFAQITKGKQSQRAVMDYRAMREGNQAIPQQGGQFPPQYGQAPQPQPQQQLEQAYQMPDTQSILASLGGLGGPQPQPFQMPQQQMQQQMPMQQQQATQQMPGQQEFDPYEAALAGVVPLAQGLQMQQREKQQQQKMQIQQEAPQRREVVKQVIKMDESAERARERLRGYDTAKTILKNATNLNVGPVRRALDKARVAEFFDNPSTQALGKVFEDINILSAMGVSTAGKMTAELIKRNALRNPSLFNSKQGALYLTDMRKLADQVEEVYAKERDKIKDKSPGGIWPVNLIEQSKRNALPKIEKIHEKMQQKTEKMLGGAGHKIEGGQLKAYSGATVRNKRTGQMGTVVNGQFVPQG